MSKRSLAYAGMVAGLGTMMAPIIFSPHFRNISLLKEQIYNVSVELAQDPFITPSPSLEAYADQNFSWEPVLKEGTREKAQSLLTRKQELDSALNQNQKSFWSYAVPCEAMGAVLLLGSAVYLAWRLR